MKISDELEETIRDYFDKLDEDTIHWDVVEPTRSKLKDVLRLDFDHCICEYRSDIKDFPTTCITRQEQMFHVKEKHGQGIDIALFKGARYKCKECGQTHNVATEQDRNNTKFIEYEKLGIDPEQVET